MDIITHRYHIYRLSEDMHLAQLLFGVDLPLNSAREAIEQGIKHSWIGRPGRLVVLCMMGQDSAPQVSTYNIVQEPPVPRKLLIAPN